MLFTDNTFYNKILAINPNIPLNQKEKDLILAFLTKRIDNYLKTHSKSIFYLDNIIGTTYQDWHGTPIIHLWQYYYTLHKKDNPNDRHAQLAELTCQSVADDMGQLLKQALIHHHKRFIYNDEWIKSYQWAD